MADKLENKDDELFSFTHLHVTIFQGWADSPFFALGNGSCSVEQVDSLPSGAAPSTSGGTLQEILARGEQSGNLPPRDGSPSGVSKKSILDCYLDVATSPKEPSSQWVESSGHNGLVLRWQTSDYSVSTDRWEAFCSWFLRLATDASHSKKGLFAPRYRFRPGENGTIFWVGPESLLPTPGGRAIRNTIVNGDFDFAVPFEMAHVYRDCLPECEHRIIPVANKLAEFSPDAASQPGSLIPLSRAYSVWLVHKAGQTGALMRFVLSDFAENLVALVPRGVRRSFFLLPLLRLAYRARLLTRSKRRSRRVWDAALRIELGA